MFYAELKRGFSTLSFKIALLIGVIFVAVHAMEIIPMPPLEDYDDVYIYTKGYIVSSYDMFMLFGGGSKVGNIFILVLPLLSVIAYADSYVEDSSGGISNFIYTRESKKKYAICKYAVNFILSGIVIAFPLSLDMIVSAMLYPTIELDLMLGGWFVVDDGLLPNLLSFNSAIYVIVTILICFLFAGVYSSIALVAGIFIKKRFVVVAIPFVVSVVVLMTTELMNMSEYSHVSILYENSSSIGITTIHFLILFIVTFIAFYYGVKKREF